MFGGSRDEGTLPEQILKLYRDLQCWKNPKRRYEELMQSLRLDDCTDMAQTAIISCASCASGSNAWRARWTPAAG